MKLNTHTVVLSSFFILMSSLTVHAQASSNYPILEKQIKEKNFSKAYKRATQLRDNNEGDPRFDYLYGLSALNTSHNNEAVFALERVVTNSPKLTRARLDLAVAYIRIKNRDAALQQFKIALSQNPPKAVQQNIKLKIRALKNTKTTLASKTKIKSTLYFSVGYDDNINFGINSEQIDLPIFGSIILDPSAVKQGSGFSETKLHIQYQNRRNKTLSTFASFNLGQRKYFKNSSFDVKDLSFRVGLTLNRNNKQYQFSLRDKPILLGDELYSNTVGLDFVIRKPIATNKIMSTAISIEKSSNKKTSGNDKSRITLHGKLDINKGKFYHQASLFLAKEWPESDTEKKYSQDLIGASYKTSYGWNNKSKSFAVVDLRLSKNQANDPIYTRRRKDNKIQLRVGHEWLINKKTSITLSAQHVKNNSNLALYDAARNEINLGIRYEW